MNVVASAVLEATINELRVSDSIVVLGAGASFQVGMPLAGQLTPLVWHTLDRHPAVLRLSGPAKVTVGEDWNQIRAAFAGIAADREARRTFQDSFASLNQERIGIQSAAHDALARLVHVGRVSRVVSLNWDTLLEHAFIARYGIGINAQGPRLWKPHGDCSNPQGNWVLPHEDGFIPDQIIEDIYRLTAARPRVLVIVGYSERDEIVVKRLIKPLEQRWRVFRIGPSAAGEGALQLSAPDALGGLAATLIPDPDIPGWSFVNFENQRGIEAAVAGERLGPKDVDVCPKLPHYASARKHLETLHTVEIVGASGCGKSITAWQLARDLNRSGWEILRPSVFSDQSAIAGVQAISSTQWKRVLVIDDSQTLPRAFVTALNERASATLKVIVAMTDGAEERFSSVRIPSQIAVETLAADFLTRRGELLPIVRSYDPQLGDEFLATPIEARIREAANSSSTPWQFAFVLRGGWSQVREQLDSLRDFERADLLLLLIAARQFLSLDAGGTGEQLVKDAGVINRGQAWVESAANLLQQKRIVLRTDRLRCLHLRAAAAVIAYSLKTRRDDTFPFAIAVFRTLVTDPSASVRGIAWLLEEVLGSDAFRFAKEGRDKFFRSSDLGALLARMVSSSTPSLRRDSAFLMSRLLWHQELGISELSRHFPAIASWLESVTGEDAYALGDLVNSISYSHKPEARVLLASVRPEIVWAQLGTARCADAYRWGHFLGRLAVAGSADWREHAKRILPREQVLSFARSFVPGETNSLSEFICGIASFDKDLGLDCVEQATPTLQQGLADDPLGSHMSFYPHFQSSVLGDGLFGEGRPSKRQRALARAMSDQIHAKKIAMGIVDCRLGDWENYARLLAWLKKFNRAKLHEVVAAVDWEALDEQCAPFWPKPPREFRLLLSSLAAFKEGDPVRRWIFKHSDHIEELDPILCGLSPETATDILRRNGRVNLAGHNASDWRLQAYAISQVAQLDRSAAVRILETNEQHVVSGLSTLGNLDVEEILPFLQIVRELDSSLLIRFCNGISAAQAADAWPRALERKRNRRKLGEVLAIVKDNTSNEEIRRFVNTLLKTG